jgi:DNA-binding XRE family transcriptional regulator
MIYAHLATPERQATLARLLEGPAAAASADPRQQYRPIPVRRRKDVVVGPHGALADRIRALRHRLGLSQADLAAKLGIGRTTLIGAEQGGRRLRRSPIERLAELGGVTVDWLLRGDATTPRAEAST